MITVWAEEEVIAEWKKRAHEQQMTFSAWLRMKADATDELPPIRYKQPKPLREEAKEIASTLLQRAVTAGDLATPTVKPSECLNRLRAGTWCGKCGATHQ